MRELTVGDVARRSGVAVSALHFYETKGLIASHRTAGNQRRYRQDVLRRVAVIRVAQEVGIPLAEVGRALAALPTDHAPTRADWTAISERWAKDLDRRIAQLKKLRGGLAHCIGCGCLSLTECNLVNRHDRLAAEGAGPRRLLVR
jgi:MerR family redox-sensitive transcriptional activator SoxR